MNPQDCLVIDCPNKTYGSYCDEHKYLRNKNRSGKVGSKPKRVVMTEIVTRTCESCGKEFIGKNTRRFCGNECRLKVQHTFYSGTGY